MARKPTGRKPNRGEDGKGAANLIAALKFVSAAQRKEGLTYQTHCVFHGGYVSAFDGLLTIGCPVEENLNACPNTLRLLEVLNKCGHNVSITQLDSGRLSIKSDKFKAFVECEKFDVMPYFGPDVQCAIANDAVIESLKMVASIADETSQRIHLAAVLLQANTAVATNGFVLLESWHGVDLPPNILIPKLAIKAIVSSGKKLVGFGFSDNSATFFYEDKSYVKTQIFADKYLNYSIVLDTETNPFPLVENFFSAVNTLAAFAEDDVLIFSPESMRTKKADVNGASYEIEGLPDGMAFNAKFLKLVEPAFVNVDFQKDKGRALFFGANARGAIMGVRIND